MKIGTILTATAIASLLFVGGVNAKQVGFGAGNPDLGPAHWIMKRMEMSKTIMDKDKDGMISKDEYMAHAEMMAGKGFMMTDMNNDGMISEDEWMNSNPDLYGGFGFVYRGFF